MAIGMLLLVALILGSIVFAAQCSNSGSHGRKAGGIVFGILWILWWSVGFPKIMQTTRNEARNDQQHFDAWHTPISVAPNVLPPPSAAHEAGMADGSSDTSVAVVSQPSSSAGKSTAAGADTVTTKPSQRPDWMNQPPGKHGDKYVVPVASGVYSDLTIREQMLDAKMAAAANRYIDELLYRQSGVADSLTLEPEYLQSFVRARTASPENNETFVRLEFDQHFRDEVDHRYKQFISLGRLKQLGGGAAAALALLGGIYCFLRLTQPAQSPANSVQTTAQRSAS